VQRAAVAAPCEPRLLTEPDHAREVLELLELVTAGLPAVDNRRRDEFRTLRQALGYAWSVAIVALPEEGKALFEHLLASDDPDVRWVARETYGRNGSSAWTQPGSTMRRREKAEPQG
jgi:hypothetical protein